MHYIELYNKTLKIKQNFVHFKMFVGGNSNNHSFHNHEDNNIGPELCKTYACFIILYLEQQFYVYHHPKSRCGITRVKENMRFAICIVKYKSGEKWRSTDDEGRRKGNILLEKKNQRDGLPRTVDVR